jgi:hypothetical protein
VSNCTRAIDETFDVSWKKFIVHRCSERHTEDMNIQLPLMLVGITATAGVGVGTIAANTGGLTIADLSALVSETAVVANDPTAGPTAPASPTATVNDTTVEPMAGTDASAGSSSFTPTAPSTVSPGTTTPSTNGTSGGSASGGYEEDDEDEHEEEDHEDEDHEDEDEHDD